MKITDHKNVIAARRLKLVRDFGKNDKIELHRELKKFEKLVITCLKDKVNKSIDEL